MKHSGEKLKASGPCRAERWGQGGVPIGGGGTHPSNKQSLLHFPHILACSPVLNTRELWKMWEVALAKGVVFTLPAP